MNYLNTETMDYPVTIEKIKMANPLTLFPEPFEPIDPYVLVAPTEPPEHDPLTHRAQEAEPVLVDGEWIQAWEVVALTTEEIESARRALVPASVTRRQARQALLLAGLLDNVQPAIDSIPDPVHRGMAQIEWDDSQAFERDRPLLIQIGMALGLDDAGLDALFIHAATL